MSMRPPVSAAIHGIILAAAALCAGAAEAADSKPFHLQEATIEDIHRGIRSGEVTCVGNVKAHGNRLVSLS